MAVRVCPSCGIPVTIGVDSVGNASKTAVVAALVATAVAPFSFVTVATTLIRPVSSASVTTYVEAVAPAISE